MVQCNNTAALRCKGKSQVLALPFLQTNMLKGGKEIQQQYKGFRNAIQKAYPELTFAKWKQKGAIVEEQQRKPAAFASILT